MELYENIKKLRIEKGWSQEELAKRTGYTDRSSIAKIEGGLVDLTQGKIKIFAEAFGVTASELMGWEDQKETSDASSPSLLAAHFDGDEFTEEELDEINKFVEYVKSKREKK